MSELLNEWLNHRVELATVNDEAYEGKLLAWSPAYFQMEGESGLTVLVNRDLVVTICSLTQREEKA